MPTRTNYGSESGEFFLENSIQFNNISDAWTIPLLRANLADSEINVVKEMTIATIDSSSAYTMIPKEDFKLF